MSMIQRTNSLASQYLRNTNGINASTAQSIKRIASGKKINSAADNASGLAIAQKMYSQVNGVSAASRNVQDTVSMVQTADGVLGTVGDTVNRMNELAVRAGNGLLGDEERQILQSEYDQLAQEIDRVGKSTSFNGNQLFDGSSYTMQVGEAEGDTMDIQMGNISASSLGLDKVDLTSAGGAGAAQKAIKNASKYISSQRADLGAAENGLRSLFNSLDTKEGSLMESLSRIMDADIGKESTNLSISRALDQVSMSMMKNSQHLLQYNALQLLMK